MRQRGEAAMRRLGLRSIFRAEDSGALSSLRRFLGKMWLGLSMTSARRLGLRVAAKRRAK